MLIALHQLFSITHKTARLVVEDTEIRNWIPDRAGVYMLWIRIMDLE
jgi:hypothetical protein